MRSRERPRRLSALSSISEAAARQVSPRGGLQLLAACVACGLQLVACGLHSLWTAGPAGCAGRATSMKPRGTRRDEDGWVGPSPCCRTHLGGRQTGWGGGGVVAGGRAQSGEGGVWASGLVCVRPAASQKREEEAVERRDARLGGRGRAGPRKWGEDACAGLRAW